MLGHGHGSTSAARTTCPICCRKVRELSSRCQEGRSFAEDARQLVDQYPHARSALDVGVDDEPVVAVSARPAGARSTSDARISFSRRASPADRRGGEEAGMASPLLDVCHTRYRETDALGPGRRIWLRWCARSSREQRPSVDGLRPAKEAA